MNQKIREWIRNNYKNAVVIDTETTGISKTDEVIQLAVVNAADGSVILNRYFRPTTSIHPQAYAVHNLSLKFLSGMSRFADEYDSIRNALSSKVTLTYNSAFDKRMLDQTCEMYGLPKINTEWNCIMQMYSKYFGISKKVKLRDACANFNVAPGNHDAVEDALAAARVLYRMRQGK